MTDTKKDSVEELPKDTPLTLHKTADHIEEEQKQDDKKPPVKSPHQQPRQSPPPKKQEEEKDDDDNDSTLIHENLSLKEYEDAKIPYVPTADEEKVELFERRTKGNWTRKVSSITWYRDIEDNEYLDWNEERQGKTDMQRKIPETVTHVGQKRVPIPEENVEYDPDAEENRVVVSATPKEVKTVFHTKYSKSRLNALIADSNARVCEYIISQEGARAYNVSKKELEKYAGDFDTLYSLKSDPNFKIVGNSDKK